jgi:maltooligosyltrehalose trehalohydrolase
MITELPAATATRFGPIVDESGTCFRLWAPSAKQAEVLIEGGMAHPMQPAADGFLEAQIPGCGPGLRYKFRIGETVFPDLASRQQDRDTSGWSIVRKPLTPSGRKTPLRPWHEVIICEVHIGTVSPEGTFNGLQQRLDHFRDAGYTCLEIMPINEFPGVRNWGYDGTLIFAPDTSYGTPEDLRALVDRAHELGLSMILDVVYNHFGETDNFVEDYAPEWFDKSVETPWGQGINFNEAMVRQFYRENACMWLSETDFDGLRIDSVHEIKTAHRDQFLRELAEAGHRAKPYAKLIIENVDNIASWLERTDNNEPVTFIAQWNDDIHHVLNHLVTGEGKGGYDDTSKDPVADLEKALADGFVHDGEADGYSDGRTRDEPASSLPPDAFITYVQNHDQIGNRIDGMRLPDRISANKLDFLHFVAFLAPQIPLFFMGEEGHLCSSFPFFVDLPEAAAAAKQVDRYDQMRKIFNEEVELGELPDPNDPETFDKAKLRWEDFSVDRYSEALARFRTLASYRRDKVWPLAATPCLDARTARVGNCLIINWIFEAGTLSMALNPNDHPGDIACIVTGPPVSTGQYSQNGDVLRLGAWSAIVW